jgi:hypothetical protein
MTNPSAVLRSLIVYAICVPVALILGYVVTSPLQWSSFGVIGAVFVILILPLMMRCHYPLMLLGWNMTMIVFFLPGAPKVWLPLTALSLGFSIVQRTIDQDFRFIRVPSLNWPLLAIGLVVLVTAEATGGIKMRAFGGEVYGGKRYIFLFAAIAGYFALTAQRIPREKAGLYVALSLLGGLTCLLGDVFYVDSRALQFLFYFFPPSQYFGDWATGGLSRFSGIANACSVFVYFMLAKYGIRNLFSVRQPWRLALFAFFAAASLLGGFRGIFITLILLLGFQFYFEGLHRTRLFPVVLVGLVLAASVSLPFVRQFPYSIQRTLSIFPIPVDPAARADAESTVNWRLEMWSAVLPQVPEYLLLGKGLALTPRDFDFGLSNMNRTGGMRAFSGDQDPMALAGDYHNGPLSVVIPFGIWGVITFLWFLAASIRALHRNYRYGDPSLKTINTFLLAVFVARVLVFMIGGSFYNDMQMFVGSLGLSVALNGGVAQPEPKPAPKTAPEPSLADMLPRPRSASERISY